jgi:RNA polymerase sigma factor (sigma-70 family)
MGGVDTHPSALKVTMQLRQFIEDNTESLMGILRSYVVRARLASDDDIPEAAQELLGEVVVEALKSSDRFDPSAHPPRAWLLKIAANLVKRKQVERFKLKKREARVRDQNFGSQDFISGDQSSESRSDAEFFDQIAARIMAEEIRPIDKTEWARPFFNPKILEDMIGDENAEGLLALVSAQDREVLRLAVIHSLDGKAVASTLKIKHGAARKRIHVALNNLRAAVTEREPKKEEK